MRGPILKPTFALPATRIFARETRRTSSMLTTLRLQERAALSMGPKTRDNAIFTHQPAPPIGKWWQMATIFQKRGTSPVLVRLVFEPATAPLPQSGNATPAHKKAALHDYSQPAWVGIELPPVRFGTSPHAASRQMMVSPRSDFMPTRARRFQPPEKRESLYRR